MKLMENSILAGQRREIGICRRSAGVRRRAVRRCVTAPWTRLHRAAVLLLAAQLLANPLLACSIIGSVAQCWPGDLCNLQDPDVTTVVLHGDLSAHNCLVAHFDKEIQMAGDSGLLTTTMAPMLINEDDFASRTPIMASFQTPAVFKAESQINLLDGSPVQEPVLDENIFEQPNLDEPKFQLPTLDTTFQEVPSSTNKVPEVIPKASSDEPTILTMFRANWEAVMVVMLLGMVLCMFTFFLVKWFLHRSESQAVEMVEMRPLRSSTPSSSGSDRSRRSTRSTDVEQPEIQETSFTANALTRAARIRDTVTVVPASTSQLLSHSSVANEVASKARRMNARRPQSIRRSSAPSALAVASPGPATLFTNHVPIFMAAGCASHGESSHIYASIAGNSNTYDSVSSISIPVLRTSTGTVFYLPRQVSSSDGKLNV